MEAIEQPARPLMVHGDFVESLALSFNSLGERRPSFGFCTDDGLEPGDNLALKSNDGADQRDACADRDEDGVDCLVPIPQHAASEPDRE